MQKKRKLLTKIGSFALAMTLLTNPLWAMAADNDAPDAVQQQESRSAVEVEEQLPEEQTLEAVPTKEQTSEVTPAEPANKDTKNYDTAGPVIEDVIFPQNGQTLQQSDTLKVGVRAHDDQSGIAAVYVDIYFSNRNDSDGHHVAYLTLEPNESDPNLYEGKLPLEGTTLTMAYIQKIEVRDNAGNVQHHDDIFNPTTGRYNYLVHVVPKEIEDVVVSDFSFSKKNIKTTKQEIIDVAFNITSNLDTSNGSFYLKFYQEDSATNSRIEEEIPIAISDSNNITSSFSLTQVERYGKWIFDGLIYFERGRNFPVQGVNTADTWFNLVDDRSDTMAPVIQSVSIDRNHEFVTAGDTVTFTIKATDDVELNPYTILYLRSVLNSDDCIEVEMTYNEKEGIYTGSFIIPNTMYPCEWYIDECTIMDAQYNRTHYVAYPTYPDYIKVKNGNTFVNPTYSISVVFNALDENKDWTTYSWKNYINVERRSTLKDLGVTFPTIPDVPGLTFEGWGLDYPYDCLMKENAEVLDDVGFYFYPVYDKSIVHTYLPYFGKDGHTKEISNVQFLPKDTPIKTVHDQVQATKLPELYPGLTFKKWAIQGDIYKDTIGNKYDVYAPALYDKTLVRYFINDALSNPDSEVAIDEYELIKCEIANAGDIVPGLKSNEKYERFVWVDYPNYEKEGILVYEFGTDVYGYGIKKGQNAPIPPKPDQVPTTPPGVTLPSEQVTVIVDKLEKLPEGEKTTVNMGNATVVPKQILETIKGKDVTVTLDMGGYTWTLNGKNVSADKLKDINLEVKFDTNAVPNKTVKEFAGDNPTKQLSLTHNGNFGFQAELTLNAGKEYAGKHANLFWYDSDKKMKFVDAGKIQPDGSVSLSFTHASDYILVMADKVMDTAGDKTNTTSNTTSVQTGDTSSIFAIVVVMIAALAVVMVILNRNKKRH